MIDELKQIEEQGLLRTLKTMRREGKYIFFEGKKFLDFGSNDYLGLTSDLDFQNEFFETLSAEKSFLMGATASRLLTGNFGAYEKFEGEIAAAYKKSALVFNSGYHANTGAIPALAGENSLVLADKLVHASIIDALKLGPAKWLRFSHNDLEHLEKLLEENHKKYGRILIVTESVFSMDGDRANLRGLVNLKEKFNALLYVDEAHGFGAFGDRGLGLCEAENLIGKIDFIMCTLGKALAGEGAFMVCEKQWKDLLVNKARSLIFSTALAPINLLWNSFAFNKIKEMRRQRTRLKNLSEYFRKNLKGLPLLGDTQIIPFVVGDSKKSLEVSENLRAAGIWAPAVRRPTVPLNSARIRFSLSAALEESDIDICIKNLLYSGQ